MLLLHSLWKEFNLNVIATDRNTFLFAAPTDHLFSVFKSKPMWGFSTAFSANEYLFGDTCSLKSNLINKCANEVKKGFPPNGNACRKLFAARKKQLGSSTAIHIMCEEWAVNLPNFSIAIFKRTKEEEKQIKVDGKSIDLVSSLLSWETSVSMWDCD